MSAYYFDHYKVLERDEQILSPEEFAGLDDFDDLDQAIKKNRDWIVKKFDLPGIFTQDELPTHCMFKQTFKAATVALENCQRELRLIENLKLRGSISTARDCYVKHMNKFLQITFPLVAIVGVYDESRSKFKKIKPYHYCIDGKPTKAKISSFFDPSFLDFTKLSSSDDVYGGFEEFWPDMYVHISGLPLTSTALLGSHLWKDDELISNYNSTIGAFIDAWDVQLILELKDILKE